MNATEGMTKGLLAHLSGRGASIRQAIAAHFLRDCRDIIEIGGAGLPITDFLTHAPDSVTVIDPRIEPFSSDMLAGRPCRVRHLATKYQTIPLVTGRDSLGVALLGLSLKPYGEHEVLNDDLVGLLRRASVVVIEGSRGFHRSVDQAPALVAAARLRTEVAIELRIADGTIDRTEHAERQLLVLKPE